MSAGRGQLGSDSTFNLNKHGTWELRSGVINPLCTCHQTDAAVPLGAALKRDAFHLCFSAWAFCYSKARLISFIDCRSPSIARGGCICPAVRSGRRNEKGCGHCWLRWRWREGNSRIYNRRRTNRLVLKMLCHFRRRWGHWFQVGKEDTGSDMMTVCLSL